MLNITFAQPAELLKPMELIREPVPGKDASWLIAERGARSYKTLPLSGPASRVSVVGRTHHHLGDGAERERVPCPRVHLPAWLRAGKRRGQLAGTFFPPSHLLTGLRRNHQCLHAFGELCPVLCSCIRSARSFQGKGEGAGLAGVVGALESVLKSPSCGCHPNDITMSGYSSLSVTSQQKDPVNPSAQADHSVHMGFAESEVLTRSYRALLPSSALPGLDRGQVATAAHLAPPKSVFSQVSVSAAAAPAVVGGRAVSTSRARINPLLRPCQSGVLFS